MSLPRWLTLIAVLVGVGCLQVAVRNAVILRGYAVGERLQRLHRQEGDLSWLTTKVAGLSSPASLANVAREHHPGFVAWSPVASSSPALVAPPDAPAGRGEGALHSRLRAVTAAGSSASVSERRNQLAQISDDDASDE